MMPITRQRALQFSRPTANLRLRNCLFRKRRIKIFRVSIAYQSINSIRIAFFFAHDAAEAFDCSIGRLAIARKLRESGNVWHFIYNECVRIFLFTRVNNSCSAINLHHSPYRVHPSPCKLADTGALLVRCVRCTLPATSSARPTAPRVACGKRVRQTATTEFTCCTDRNVTTNNEEALQIRSRIHPTLIPHLIHISTKR